MRSKPPARFNGVEHGSWGRYGYKRVCADEEIALLDAAQTLDQADERAAQDAERTAYFADLAAELAAEGTADDDPSRHPGLDPGSACSTA